MAERKREKCPDLDTADRVEYVTPDELRARGGLFASLWCRVLEAKGWFGYVEPNTGDKVLLIAR